MFGGLDWLTVSSVLSRGIMNILLYGVFVKY
jgi:hypothetical protein